MRAHHELMEANNLTHKYPNQTQYAKDEFAATKEYNIKHPIYEKCLTHKAKIEWSKFGIKSTTLFHQSIIG